MSSKFAFIPTPLATSILRGLPYLCFLLLFPVLDEVSALGLDHPNRLLPRTSRPDPITIPIHALQGRSPADNSTLGIGLSTVAMASDRMCVPKPFSFLAFCG
jgi:hypothetical protein